MALLVKSTIKVKITWRGEDKFTIKKLREILKFQCEMDSYELKARATVKKIK